MQLFELIKLINKILPPETAMADDRIGIQIESDKLIIKSVLISFEINEDTVEEAINSGSDCIVVFHPLIFMPLKKIIQSDRVGRLVSKLIKNDISLISVHTAFDSFINGTNKILADLFGLKIISKLVPDPNYEGCGMGIIGEFDRAIHYKELIERVHNVCKSPLKFTEGKTEFLKTVAVVGGSGSSFLNDVLAKDIDAFITADISYHTFHAVKGKLWLIDPGHYEMEQFVGRGIAESLAPILPNEISIVISKSYTNPVRYFPNDLDYERLQIELLNKYTGVMNGKSN